MHELINWLLTTMNAMGYPGIFILMAMESSVIPVTSELVMPPAGYLAQKGEMSMTVAILCGTVGSLVGAYHLPHRCQHSPVVQLAATKPGYNTLQYDPKANS